MQKKPSLQKLAKKRIIHLFQEAEKVDAKLADRYVQLAWKVKLKVKLTIPRPYNKQFCRKCLAYWGKDGVRVRTQGRHIVYTCKRCKNIRRFTYKPGRGQPPRQ